MMPQHDGAPAIADAVPSDSPGAKEIGFAIPQTYNASRILFDNRQGSRRPAGADRSARHAQLHRTLCGGLALGPRLYLAWAEARRPHPDVPRRYAGLSGRILRRGPRRLRAAADQYADAAGPAAILPVGSECPVAVADAEFCSRFNAEACTDTALHTLIAVNGAAGDHAVPNAIAADRGCRDFPPTSLKPTPTATRWRSGCIRRARPDGPRASSICSTTWPIAISLSRGTC